MKTDPKKTITRAARMLGYTGHFKKGQSYATFRHAIKGVSLRIYFGPGPPKSKNVDLDGSKLSTPQIASELASRIKVSTPSWAKTALSRQRINERKSGQ